MKDLASDINMSKACRVCLTEEKNMKSLFSVEQVLEKDIEISDILMACSSISIVKDEGLPEKICRLCSEQANIAYLFKKLCESSDRTLRELSKQFEIQRELLIDDDKENDFSLEEQDLVTKTETGNDGSTSDEEFGDAKKPEKHNVNISSNTFECDSCLDSLKEDLLLHIKNVHKSINKKTTGKNRDLLNTCNICQKSFRFHSNLERHKLVHSGNKPFLCNVCGKRFGQFSALKIHTFIHTGEKPYKCQICTQKFTAPSTLVTHVRTHTGERPHICKICGKHFPQAGYLASHIRTHTGEKPVECKVCGNKFNQSSRLKTHMRIHTGEKPHQCEICKRCFAVKSTLKKHMRTHTGERPYPCQICGQSFAQSSTLTTHLKVHKSK